MPTHKRLPTIATTLALAGALAAQKPDHPEQLTRETIRRWETLAYNLGRAGVKKISFTIKVESRGGMTGTWKAQATYSFDGDTKHPDGILTWDDEEIEHAMNRRGWTAKFFGRDIRSDTFRTSIAGSKLVATARKNGTILTVTPRDRESTRPETHYLFDKKGVLVGTVAGLVKKRLSYEVRNGKHLRTGEHYALPSALPGGKGPETKGELRIRHEEVRGYFVPAKMTETIEVQDKMAGHLVFAFKDYKIEPAAPEKKPQSPRAGDAKAAKKK